MVCQNDTFEGSLLWFLYQLQGQDEGVGGEEEPATPKKIFQLLIQVNV